MIILFYCCHKNDSYGKIAHRSIVQSIPGLRSQERNERSFTVNSAELIVEIVFERLETPIYRPTFVKMDAAGSIYILDFYDFAIHRFMPEGLKSYRHSVIRTGKSGPKEEFRRITDIRIFNDRIYLVDQRTCAIEIYSPDGLSAERLVLSDKSCPNKIAFSDDKLIVECINSPEKLFRLCDSAGNVANEFGDYIDKTYIENAVYHDNDLSDTFTKNRFYYLPYYLGFVGLYQENRLLFVKETIDGIRNRSAPIKKKTMNNEIVYSIDRTYETASLNATFDEFILIVASDKKKKKSYWDIYSLEEFDYIVSIKDNPVSQFVNIQGGIMPCLTEDSLRIYDINKILPEIRKAL